MRNEGAVHSKKLQPLDPTLREQHPVERIARHGLGFDGSEGVMLVDRDDLYAHVREEAGKALKPGVSLSLPTRHLMAISQRLAALK